MQPDGLIPRLPYNFARQHGVCLLEEAGALTLTYTPATPPAAIAEARRFAGRSFACKEVRPAEFETILTELYTHSAGSAQRMAQDMEESLSLENALDTVSRTADLLAQEDDAPIIRLINALLMEALREGASDIHFETYEQSMAVRLRIDGILQETASLEPRLAPLLVSRLKVMAQLDIAEKRLPQDGRISLRLGEREVDVRVSTIPTGSTERVVLRILDKQAGKLRLPQLGLNEQAISLIKGIIHKPHGIVLVTGPTGSGKTTSLYAMIAELNDKSRNILTIEDPVEYQISGIGQTQVNTKVELTFARGLRAILRQDPDIVMVGEIRDTETASIAVQASLTGHLVLSTLHTNTAIGAITRLADMGIEPFLLSSGLTAILAQRLVRTLCHECKQAAPPSQKEAQYLAMPKATVIYRAAGCRHCKNTGYKGRSAIYEIVMVDDTLQRMIHDKASESIMLAHLRQQPYYVPLASYARDKVLQGMTTLEEVIRVTSMGEG